MFRYLVFFAFIGKTVVSTASGSGLGDELMGLQGAVDRQVLYLGELTARQGNVQALFDRVAKAFPRPEVVYVKRVESNAISKIRQRFHEQKQALAETTAVPLPSETTIDDVRTLLLRELGSVNTRPMKFQMSLALLAEQFGNIQDVEGGIQVMRTCQTILSFLSERVNASNNILRSVAAIKSLSKKKRDLFTAPLIEYRTDAEADVAAQTAIRDSVMSAVRALIQKKKQLETLDEQEVERIMESFELVELPDVDFDGVVLTMEDIEKLAEAEFDLCEIGGESDACTTSSN